MWVLVGFVSFFALGCALAWRAEARDWNGGVEAVSGKPWRRFGTDSQGGRGYKVGERHIWISWPGIDTKEPQ